MKNCDRDDVDEKIMIKAMAMVKFFLKVFRVFMMTISKKESTEWVHALVCLIVATALDKMHYVRGLMMKDVAR